FEEGRHVVLRGAVAADGTDADAPYDFTWAFVLIDGGPGTTRLVVRERYAYLTGWAGALVEPVEMVSFLMSQRMLRGIRERAERGTSAGPSNPPTVMGAIADDENPPVSNVRERRPTVPPRWFVRLAWRVHRGMYQITGGRVGLWRPKPQGWGTLHLTTTGRRTGHDREVILGYFEDGPNLVTMAMNGWADPEPAWWLNLQAQPDATVVVRDGPRLVHARAAHGDERSRLWSRWREIDTGLDELAALRSSETAVVILEPRSAPKP
ncbi:MAG TPA: nitroreductase/quinone reductase family protein, partial [Actinomycetota bacterium]